VLGRQTISRLFRQDSEDECHGNVVEPATAEAKQGTTHSWSALGGSMKEGRIPDGNGQLLSHLKVNMAQLNSSDLN
jgi:hypothetical protein